MKNENLEQQLDLEYLFNNYIKARSSSNAKTRHRSYTLLHVALLADMDYLDAKEFSEESKKEEPKIAADKNAKRSHR
jgi:hypothetical protein